jgi:AcrR family transcriptional regulator|tara:strand:+ start:172 stop:777 length:606 start_codon:yes stop_codon:yes gene_type:complete
MIVNKNHNEGTRETNKTKNRQAIIEAGIRIFIDKGVSETTVRDIIRSTGLASGTFYNYFNSKEEVLVAIFDDFAKEIGKSVRDENVQPESFEEFLRIKLTRFFKFVSSKPEIYMIMSNNHNLVNNFSINTPQIILEIDYLKEEISDYIKKGVFPNFDVDLFALVVRPITDSLAQEMMSQKKIDINKYTEKCINFLTKGLGV